MATLNALLDRCAQEGGAKTALVCGSRSLSFLEVRASVLRIAESFRRSKIAKGDRVAIVSRNSIEFVVSYFALSRLGAIAVPINFMVSKADELAYMLNDCGAKAVITQKEFAQGVSAAALKCPALTAIWVGDDPLAAGGLLRPLTEHEDALVDEFPKDVTLETDVAAILYTSGTTGFPKGVMLTHRNLISNCQASLVRAEATRADVSLCILPMFHSLAWLVNVLISLRLTIPCIIFPSITPAKPWLRAMGRYGVSIFLAVPQVYAALARESRDWKTRMFIRRWAFRRARVAISGAAPLPHAVTDAFRSATGLEIMEGWGLTETSPVATFNPPRRVRIGTVGTPLDGVDVKAIDENGLTLPAGGEGELCVRGDNVMLGYWNLPDATRAVFTPDGWLKTGDIGIIDADGYVSIRDRMKDMIIIKGLKVFPAQVEAIITEHPAIEEAALIGIPTEDGGETIKVFVVLKKGATASKSELQAFFREKLDAYKRPRDIDIVESLPKNSLQKVLKRELRERELNRRSAMPRS